MNQIPAIKSVMTAFPYWIDIDETLIVAEQMMLEHEINHLPVKEGNKLTAILSAHDIKQSRLVCGETIQTVKDICVSDVYTVDLTEPLDNVIAHMASNHIGSALVMKNEQLAGVFTINDACHQFVKYLRYQFRESSGDDLA